MKRLKQLLTMGGVLLALGWAASTALAQDPNAGPGGPGAGGGFGGPGGGFGGPGGGFGGPGGGGNFDPAQMQQMMLDAQRQQLEVTNDDEWSIISAQIQKVNDARMQANSGGFGGFGGRRGGRGGRGGGLGGGPGGGGGFQFPGMANAQADPTQEALQRAIDSNASSDELKAAIAKFVDSRKQKQDALAKTQAELRKLLTVRQEAIAYTMGLL